MKLASDDDGATRTTSERLEFGMDSGLAGTVESATVEPRGRE